jgi:hypothetical protein
LSPSTPRRTQLLAAAGVAAIVLAAVLVVLFIWQPGGDDDDEPDTAVTPLATAAPSGSPTTFDLQLTSAECAEGDGRLTVVGSVRNVSGRIFENVVVTATFRTPDGDTLGRAIGGLSEQFLPDAEELFALEIVAAGPARCSVAFNLQTGEKLVTVESVIP